MVTLTSAVERRGDASLVELVVANGTPVPRRIRVANRLDGPVWPPRSQGVPEDGWDDGGFEGVLGPGERLGLGYACPAEPADPPAEIAWCERAADGELDEPRWGGRGGPRTDGGDGANRGEVADAARDGTSTDPEAVIRALGDPRPPRDAVYDVEAVADSGPGPLSDPGPESVEDWFAAVEARLERGNALGEPTTLLDAAKSVERAGSLAAVERLLDDLADDAVELRRVERRAAALAERAEETAEDVPLSAFRRLS